MKTLRNMLILLTFIVAMPGYTSTLNNCISTEGADSIKGKDLGGVEIVQKNYNHQGQVDYLTVTKAMIKKAITAGDLLSNIPGMQYNSFTKDVRYLGSQNVIILVDSVERDMNYIKNLNPNRFSKISVVNYPGGKYQNYDAVINYTTKHNYEGYDLNASTQVKIQPNDNNGDGKNLKSQDNDLSFTYTRSKINVAFNSSLSFSDVGSYRLTDEIYPLNDVKQIMNESVNNSPNIRNRQVVGNANLAVDYEISKDHSLSITWQMDPYNSKFNRQSIIDTYSLADVWLGRKDNSMIAKNKSMQNFWGLYYRGTVGKWRLNSVVSYTDARADHRQTSNLNGFLTSYDYNMDYRYLWAGAGASASLGDKLYFSTYNYLTYVKSDSREPATGRLLSGNKDIRDNFTASLNYNPTKKVSLNLMAGFNFFHMESNGKGDTHITPIGRISASWFISDQLTLRMNYNITSGYPSLTQMMDHSSFVDSLICYTGNPLLRMSHGHNININANIRKSFSIGLFANIVDNTVYNIAEAGFGLRPDGITGPYVSYRFQNGGYKTIGAFLSYTKNVLKNLNVQVNGNVGYALTRYKDYKSRILTYSVEGRSIYSLMDNNLNLFFGCSYQRTGGGSPQSDSWCIRDQYGAGIQWYINKRRIVIFGQYYFPLHFTNGHYHGGMASEALITRTHGNDLSIEDNEFRIGIQLMLHHGDAVKRYNRERSNVAY